MNIVNRTTGALIGVVTGVITPLIQIPYAYYLFYQTLTREKFSWPVALLATITIGNLAVLWALLGIVINAPGTLFAAIKTGWREGVIGAIKFPYTFHAWFHHNSHRLPNIQAEGKSIFTPKGWFLKLISKMARFALLGSTYYERMDNPKLAIYDKIMNDIYIRPYYLPDDMDNAIESKKDSIGILGLSDEEIEEFKQAIDANKSAPTYAENLKLYEYLTHKDPISYQTVNEIELPITEENTTTGLIITYEYDYFCNALKHEEAKIAKERSGDLFQQKPMSPSQQPLDEVIIYKGFYKGLDVNHIRQVIDAWKESLKLTSVDIPTGTSSTASVSSTLQSVIDEALSTSKDTNPDSNSLTPEYDPTLDVYSDSKLKAPQKQSKEKNPDPEADAKTRAALIRAREGLMAKVDRTKPAANKTSSTESSTQPKHQ